MTRPRDRSLDALRALATVRVVLFHATGSAKWSWVAAMPVMFFVGGALFAQSLERHAPIDVLRTRLRRIMVPTWAFTAVVFIAYTAAGVWGEVPRWGIPGFIVPIMPAVGPRTVDGPMYWTWMALWYINAYVLFMLVGVPLRRLHQRFPHMVLALLALPVLISGLLRQPGFGLLGYLVFWVLGYSFHDRRRSLPDRRTCFIVGGVCMGIGVAYAAAFTGFSMALSSEPFVDTAVGLAWIAAAVGAAPMIEAVVALRPVDIIVTWVQQRALTIYLWHTLAVAVARSWATDAAGLGSSSVVQVVEVFAITFAFTLGLGWIEDLAAKRPARLIPLVTVDPIGVDLRERINLRTERESLRDPAPP